MKFLIALLVFLSVGVPIALPWEIDTSTLDMAYPRQPEEGLLVGGQPSIRDLEILAEAGFELVINLRTPGEFDRYDEQEAVRAAGMDYLSIPVHGMDDFSAGNAGRIHEALEGASGPVLAHCTVGARAGGLLAVEKHLFHGYSRSRARAYAAEAHMHHMGEYVDRALDRLAKAM